MYNFILYVINVYVFKMLILKSFLVSVIILDRDITKDFSIIYYVSVVFVSSADSLLIIHLFLHDYDEFYLSLQHYMLPNAKEF